MSNKVNLIGLGVMGRPMARNLVKAGFDVVAWPTDYRTSGREGVGFFTDNATDSLQNKRNTEAVETGPNQMVSARIVEHHPERILPLAEVRERVLAQVRADQAAAAAKKDGEALVATVNEYLDLLDGPQARAYMTCRAVQAAKIDFDATDEDRNENRSEERRRAEQFFRIEASVGMD